MNSNTTQTTPTQTRPTIAICAYCKSAIKHACLIIEVDGKATCSEFCARHLTVYGSR
jgi:hypothetical protein